MATYSLSNIKNDPIKIGFIRMIYKYFSEDIKSGEFSIDQCKYWCNSFEKDKYHRYSFENIKARNWLVKADLNGATDANGNHKRGIFNFNFSNVLSIKQDIGWDYIDDLYYKNNPDWNKITPLSFQFWKLYYSFAASW